MTKIHLPILDFSSSTRSTHFTLPFWLIVVSIILSLYFVYLELGEWTSWDVESPLNLDVFRNLYLMSNSFPQWNPLIQSGNSLHGNLQFPLSFHRIITLLTEDVRLNYFIGNSLLFLIGMSSLSLLLKSFGLHSFSCLLAILLSFVFIRSYPITEFIPLCAAAVVFYSVFSFLYSRRFYLLVIGAAFLGLCLNNWVIHGTIVFVGLHFFLIIFFRTEIDWKLHLGSVAFVWFFGILLSLPTLLPQVFDIGGSSPSTFVPLKYSPTNDVMALPFILSKHAQHVFRVGFSYGMIIPVALALCAHVHYWDTYNSSTKAWIKALYCLVVVIVLTPLLEYLLIVFFNFYTHHFFDLRRLMFALQFCVVILFAIAVDRAIFRSENSY